MFAYFDQHPLVFVFVLMMTVVGGLVVQVVVGVVVGKAIHLANEVRNVLDEQGVTADELAQRWSA